MRHEVSYEVMVIKTVTVKTPDDNKSHHYIRKNTVWCSDYHDAVQLKIQLEATQDREAVICFRLRMGYKSILMPVEDVRGDLIDLMQKVHLDVRKHEHVSVRKPTLSMPKTNGLDDKMSPTLGDILRQTMHSQSEVDEQF